MLGIGFALLAVSAVSFVIQSTSLVRILKQPAPANRDQRLANRGLIRTSITRVAASILYIVVAIRALSVPADATFSLLIFTVVQLLWQANALSDVRLRRRLSSGLKLRGRHRKE